MKRVYLSQVVKHYDLGIIHNPKHFIPSSLYIEEDDGRLYLKGKHFEKSFTKIAILKPKDRHLPPILKNNFFSQG